jgi:hypothetical protein
MERIIKFLAIIIICITGIITSVRAEELTMQQLTTPTNVPFSDCFKTYNLSADNLYYYALDSIAANRFEIKELQSKSGYIIFKAAGREFLAAVAYYGPNKSILKITPANNSYYFAPGIVLNIFKFIDMNLNEQIKEIPKS